MWGFKKRTLKQQRFAKRKQYLQSLIARLTERKTILEIEVEDLKKQLEKAHKDFKDVMRRGAEDEWHRRAYRKKKAYW